jgi:hypothetical protein
MWIKPPPTCTTKNPSTHRINRITAIVQSIVESSQEVRYTWRDGKCRTLYAQAYRRLSVTPGRFLQESNEHA